MYIYGYKSMRKIIGIEKKDYDFQGHQGYNYRIHMSSDILKNGCGVSVSYIKVKPNVLDRICRREGIEYTELLGSPVEVIYYDNYKNVVDILLHE